jgi:hypothetical protein
LPLSRLRRYVGRRPTPKAKTSAGETTSCYLPVINRQPALRGLGAARTWEPAHRDRPGDWVDSRAHPNGEPECRVSERV